MASCFGVRVTACVMGNGAFIDLARNLYVEQFLRDKDYTHLFFIDADLKFPYQAFINLCLSGRPVVAGAYRRRQDPEDYPVKWMPHPEISEEKGEDCLWIEDDHWLQCDRVPTGFLCIERSVLEKMADKAKWIRTTGNPAAPELFYTKIDDEDRFVGEDFCWCDDYMEMFDKPIEVLMDVDFVHGGFKGNYLNYLRKQVDAQEKSSERRLGDRRKDVA